PGSGMVIDPRARRPDRPPADPERGTGMPADPARNATVNRARPSEKCGRGTRFAARVHPVAWRGELHTTTSCGRAEEPGRVANDPRNSRTRRRLRPPAPGHRSMNV